MERSPLPLPPDALRHNGKSVIRALVVGVTSIAVMLAGVGVILIAAMSMGTEETTLAVALVGVVLVFSESVASCGPRCHHGGHNCRSGT